MSEAYCVVALGFIGIILMAVLLGKQQNFEFVI